MKSRFIYVPQGCYAEITNNTPLEVKGLLTAGMDPCCHVIVTNSQTGYIALCHVDSSINLEDPNHGIPAWIQKACPDKHYKNLVVDVGEQQNKPRFTAAKEQNYPIFDQVQNSLNKITGSTTALLNHNTNAYDRYGISINRSNYLIRKEKYDKALAKEDIQERYKVDEVTELYLTKGPLFESSIINARSNADNVNHANNHDAPSLRFPPICVFDGRSNDFLSLEEIKQSYNNGPAIDWIRVTNNAPSRDSTPPTANDHLSSSSSAYKQNVIQYSKNNLESLVYRNRSDSDKISDSESLKAYNDNCNNANKSSSNNMDDSSISESESLKANNKNARKRSNSNVSDVSDSSKKSNKSQKSEEYSSDFDKESDNSNNILSSSSDPTKGNTTKTSTAPNVNKIKERLISSSSSSSSCVNYNTAVIRNQSSTKSNNSRNTNISERS